MKVEYSYNGTKCKCECDHLHFFTDADGNTKVVFIKKIRYGVGTRFYEVGCVDAKDIDLVYGKSHKA